MFLQSVSNHKHAMLSSIFRQSFSSQNRLVGGLRPWGGGTLMFVDLLVWLSRSFTHRTPRPSVDKTVLTGCGRLSHSNVFCICAKERVIQRSWRERTKERKIVETQKRVNTRQGHFFFEIHSNYYIISVELIYDEGLFFTKKILLIKNLQNDFMSKKNS